MDDNIYSVLSIECWKHEQLKKSVDLIVFGDIRFSWCVHFQAEGAFKSLCELVDQVVSSLAEIVHLCKQFVVKGQFLIEFRFQFLRIQENSQTLLVRS